MPDKKTSRQDMTTRLKALSSQARQAKSLAIGDKLFGLENFKRARCVCFYVSLPLEVDTGFMIDKALSLGKTVCVPLSDSKTLELTLYQIQSRDDLQKGAWGIQEPAADSARHVPAGKVDCVVVPGVVFDRENHRIGKGKVFYDRFLAKLNPDTFKVGLAFDFQVVDKISNDPHDKKCDLVLTD